MSAEGTNKTWETACGLAELFPKVSRPGLSRRVIQLTRGGDFCYPLYYFIPSITADGRWMIYHRETPGSPHEIQLHRLDLRSGETHRITACRGAGAHWQPWGEDPAKGVLGDRSALAVERGLLIYFDGRQARCVSMSDGADKALFEVPEDRYVLSQNCFTGDERWFVYVDVDRNAFQTWLERGRKREEAGMCEGTAVRAHNVDTGERRVLFYINYPVHHVHPVGEREIAFSHIPGDLLGMGLASLDRPGYRIPRPRDERDARIIHHVPTRRGIAYELSPADGARGAGMLDPESGQTFEFPVPGDVNHTGLDPEGRVFFYQRKRDRLQAIRRFDSDGEHEWQDLIGSWATYGRGQKAHFHPRFVLNGKWMQMVAGDPETETNHIFLVDVADMRAPEDMPQFPWTE